MPIATYGITLSPGRRQHSEDRQPRRATASSRARSRCRPPRRGRSTTRTDNDTGIVTVASGHGIMDTDTVDVYWDGGPALRRGRDRGHRDHDQHRRRGGNNLPDRDDARHDRQAGGDQRGHRRRCHQGRACRFEFTTATDHRRRPRHVQGRRRRTYCRDRLGANQPQIYDIAGGQANPFTGDPITECLRQQRLQLAGRHAEDRLAGGLDAVNNAVQGPREQPLDDRPAHRHRPARQSRVGGPLNLLDPQHGEPGRPHCRERLRDAVRGAVATSCGPRPKRRRSTPRSSAS